MQIYAHFLMQTPPFSSNTLRTVWYFLCYSLVRSLNRQQLFNTALLLALLHFKSMVLLLYHNNWTTLCEVRGMSRWLLHLNYMWKLKQNQGRGSALKCGGVGVKTKSHLIYKFMTKVIIIALSQRGCLKRSASVTKCETTPHLFPDHLLPLSFATLLPLMLVFCTELNSKHLLRSSFVLSAHRTLCCTWVCSGFFSRPVFLFRGGTNYKVLGRIIIIL